MQRFNRALNKTSGGKLLIRVKTKKAADLIFEKDLICGEDDIKLQSLAVCVHPLMSSDL